MLLRTVALAAATIGGLVWTAPLREAPIDQGAPSCDEGNAGLTLPEGFCAVLVAESVTGVRHIAVSPNGDLFVGRRGRQGAGLTLFRDTDGDGKADVVRVVHPEGGTGVLVTEGFVYYALADKILRFPWRVGALEASGPAETIVAGLPTGGHGEKSMALGPNGALFVNIGSRTNSCQIADRQDRSEGHDPCTELETRAGIWRFDATRTGQTQADGQRVTTGVRNAMALSIDPTGRLWAAVHGRDQLAQNWGYSEKDGAEKPGEEFGPMEGADYGWPYCYYDPVSSAKVMSPEYGGDGQQVGRCATATQPVVAFPGHWAPMATLFYTGSMFPAEYRGGAFVAFHGSWNRAPLPQAGFRVAFVPMRNGRPAGAYRNFLTPSGAETSIRPSGLALGPDGSLYITADVPGKIWRVMYRP